MMLFIQAAHAADAATTPMGQAISFLPMILMLVVFYFFLIRPQQKRAKEHKAMTESLAAGSEVVFAGGLMGKIKSVEGEYAVVSLNPTNEIKIQKASVISVLPNGTLDSL
ncbi:preprotein translocase subunit YajC [Psychrobacter sp. HD31]|uniref:preprotein translocase subunit YajC n=1 Tax=Psychrobacter sp. HD31 TaxID=3112003 RepID=UPI003DA5B87B